MLSLDNPMDRSYLCAVMCMCNQGTKLKDSLGRALKQRCTTASIWNDEERNQLVWRYKAEVGYSMASHPPAPLMSREQPNRPSRFPLGRAMADGLLKWQLDGKPQKGLLRIPDCIILATTGEELAAMRASRKIDWKRLMPVQENIEAVVEIKFEGDTLKRHQLLDYRTIAGERDKFQILEIAECDCKSRREIPENKPVRVPVTTPLESERTKRRHWFRPNPPPPHPIPAPQPVRPDYGPVASEAEGESIVDFLKGAAVVGGSILVGAIAIAALPLEAAGAAAAALVVLAAGTRTANAKPIGKKDKY
ncbi:hypothetical protein MKD49_12660 [Herbaspirillum sp. WGmk3]|uniref:hypothetical protein n=1 Tax=Herbaspirillum sp. WGmk3 TaxID=2919925 RepID=UPI0020909194|nr:hypothetical protein [Herbaspirillum sp. WGmk3]MCO4857331.1 hypothetical protein [Herbaspirillum sp. WGmk3]